MTRKKIQQIVAAAPGHDLLTYFPPDSDGPALAAADPIIAWAWIEEDWGAGPSRRSCR